MKRIGVALLVVGLLAVVLPAGAFASGTNLVRDGGFEYPVLAMAGETSFVYGTGRTFAHQAWHVNCGDVQLDTNAVFPAFKGDQSIDMNGTQPGCIFQYVPLGPSTKYRVTWQVAPPIGDGTQSWELTLIVSGLGGVPMSGQTCTLPPAQCWQTFTRTFTTSANPGTTEIEFDSNTSGANGPHVDQVNIHPTR